MRIIARFRRLLHCLPRLFAKDRHRMVDIAICGRVVYIACECGRAFYVSRDPVEVYVLKGWAALMGPPPEA